VATTLHDWLTQRPADATPPALIDLGCGDLAVLAPLLRELPLGRYTGLDLAAVVLPLAQQALGPVGYATQWREGDLLGWAEAQDGADHALDQPDILHSAFANPSPQRRAEEQVSRGCAAAHSTRRPVPLGGCVPRTQ